MKGNLGSPAGADPGLLITSPFLSRGQRNNSRSLAAWSTLCMPISGLPGPAMNPIVVISPIPLVLYKIDPAAVTGKKILSSVFDIGFDLQGHLDKLYFLFAFLLCFHIRSISLFLPDQKSSDGWPRSLAVRGVQLRNSAARGISVKARKREREKREKKIAPLALAQVQAFPPFLVGIWCGIFYRQENKYSRRISPATIFAT